MKGPDKTRFCGLEGADCPTVILENNQIGIWFLAFPDRLFSLTSFLGILLPMDNLQSYSSWVEIDLSAIQNNIRLIAQRTGAQVMAVIKANAYGHGAMPVARAALEAGATWFGVSSLDEALELRQGGLTSPILALGYTPLGRLAEAIADRISITVWTPEQVESASSLAGNLGKMAGVHLKVDTGMSRLGVQPEEALHLGHQLAEAQNILFEGIFTHYARSDEADRTTTDLQEARFREVLAGFESDGIRPPLVHAANSAASISRPEACFDLVRAGIAIYGLHPSKECRLPSGFRPALTWKGVLSQVKVLPPGRGVSYGHIYTTRDEERIGTLPVGYADGFRRIEGNQVLVRGKRVPVVGRVCMDQSMLLLDALAQARSGDEVVLIGSQGGERITAEEVAGRWNTVNYEVVCGIGARVPRVYI
jgi:alanine racemase